MEDIDINTIVDGIINVGRNCLTCGLKELYHQKNVENIEITKNI